MRGRRSTRKPTVYKRKSRKSKKTTTRDKRHVKRRNKQSIKRRNYRGGKTNVLIHINQNDYNKYKFMLFNLNYLSKDGDKYLFEIKYLDAVDGIITKNFTYNKLNNILDIANVTNDEMNSLLIRNKGQLLNFINTKIQIKID